MITKENFTKKETKDREGNVKGFYYEADFDSYLLTVLFDPKNIFRASVSVYIGGVFPDSLELSESVSFTENDKWEKLCEVANRLQAEFLSTQNQ